MDAAIAHHYGALQPDAGYSSLHDDFLQDIQDTVGCVFALCTLAVLQHTPLSCDYTQQTLKECSLSRTVCLLSRGCEGTLSDHSPCSKSCLHSCGKISPLLCQGVFAV